MGADLEIRSLQMVREREANRVAGPACGVLVHSGDWDRPTCMGWAPGEDKGRDPQTKERPRCQPLGGRPGPSLRRTQPALPPLGDHTFLHLPLSWQCPCGQPRKQTHPAHRRVKKVLAVRSWVR